MATSMSDSWLAGLLAEHGVSKENAPPPLETLKDTPQRVSFRGQAVLRSLAYPEAERITRVCSREGCGNVYTTNYWAVAYCSNECMEYRLKHEYGMSWIPHAQMKKERWEVRTEPEMIPMQALKAMKMIVSRVEHDLGHPIEIDELSFSKLPPGLLRPSEKKSPSASESPEASYSEESFQAPQEDHLPLDTQIIPAQSEPLQQEEDDLLSLLFAD